MTKRKSEMQKQFRKRNKGEKMKGKKKRRISTSAPGSLQLFYFYGVEQCVRELVQPTQSTTTTVTGNHNEPG